MPNHHRLASVRTGARLPQAGGPSWCRFLLLPLALLALAACNRDPYKRTDVWKPTGANAANLAAMVANPNDLVRGRDTATTSTKASTAAVERIWNDSPRSLNPAASGGGSGGGGSSGSGGGASSGGGEGGGGSPGLSPPGG